VKDRIKVVDSRPGAGKTSMAIQYINKLPPDIKIIYITPFLKECERIKSSCPEKDFYAPDARKGKGSKMINLVELIYKGKNVVSTHALFSNIDDTLIEAIKSQNYILFLDEVMSVVEKFDLYKDDCRKSEETKEQLTRSDIKVLLEKDIIRIADDDGRVVWINDESVLNKYIQLKTLADRNLLYLVNGELLLWTFPIEVFREGVFDEIYILTYQFDAQIQAYYYKYFELEYSRYIVQETAKRVYELFPFEDYPNHDQEWIESIRDLINICDSDKLNKIGSSYFNARNTLVDSALSKTWFDHADYHLKSALTQNCGNYFQNVTKSKAQQRMWTCFKYHRKDLQSNNLSKKNWIELNARATNDYADRNVLVYPINRYINPFYLHFFSKKGIAIDQDKYALSELIQWMFRSAIRNNKPIQIYIPSERMRKLLISWLNK
jgi:hypothetical protein